MDGRAWGRVGAVAALIGLSACGDDGGGRSVLREDAAQSMADAGSDNMDAQRPGLDAAHDSSVAPGYGDASDADALPASDAETEASDAAQLDAASADASGAASDAGADASTSPSCSDPTTAQNCGSCGYACPGLMQPNDNVSCLASSCTFSCQGESYDVDNSPANGCEVTDPSQDNHSRATAAYQGMVSACDTTFTITGQMVSDRRVHEMPPVQNFVYSTGSAPDFYSVIGQGGGVLCNNDLVVTLKVMNAIDPTCYSLSAYTDKGTQSCQTGTTGVCSINRTNGSQFTSGSEIDFGVQKTGANATIESVLYSISGHL